MNKTFALVIFSCTLMSNNVFSMLRRLIFHHPKARFYSSYGRPSIFTDKVYPESKEGLAELLHDNNFAQECLRSLLLDGTKRKNSHLLKLINQQNAVIEKIENISKINNLSRREYCSQQAELVYQINDLTEQVKKIIKE